MKQQRLLEILLVEDNPGDVLLTKKAFASSEFPNRLNVVGDGEAALQYLRREAPYENAPRPDLVLLDINLPKLSGTDVLSVVKADPDLLTIPIVMLTSSERDSDVHRAYHEHVNSYITKPPTFTELTEVIRNLENYWFGAVKRPPDTNG